MCEQKIWIILISQIFVISLYGQLFNRKAIKFTRLEVNCRGRNVPVVGYLRGVKSDIRSVFVGNSTVIVKENLMNNLQAIITVHRCLTRENLDSCEEFFKRENLNYCQLINPDNIVEAGSPLAVHYSPKLKCPFKKGVYHAYNFTINLVPLIVVALDGWYWKVEVNVYSPHGRRLIGCSNLEGYTVLRTID